MDSRAVCWLNGEILPAAEARISVLDHGLLYGDGVFEGVRFYNHRAFRLPAHLDRLDRSARAIALQIPCQRSALIEAVTETVAAFGRPDGYLRLVVTRGAGPMGLDPRGCDRPNVFLIADQLRLALNRLSYDLMLPIDFVRMKARAAGDVAVGDALMARAELRGIWLDAARRSSVAICDKVIADDFSKLTLDLTPGERQREQVLLRQLLEAGVLGHMPEGGEIRYSIPGWLVSEAITRSGLTEQRLVAALGDRDSPDRCRAEAALTQAVLASPGRVPTEVLKGL